MLVVARNRRQLRLGEYLDLYEPVEADSLRQYLLEGFFRTSGAAVALWEQSGSYVSALRLEPYRDGLLMAGLVTAPDHRRRGYAGQLIQAVQAALSPETKLYSHVSKANVPSLRLHEACGFHIIRDSARYLDGSVDFRCCTLLYEKSPASM